MEQTSHLQFTYLALIYTQFLGIVNKRQHIYANIRIKLTFFHTGCIINTHLPGSLEGVQGTEFGTYPCLVATTTEGVPRW